MIRFVHLGAQIGLKPMAFEFQLDADYLFTLYKNFFIYRIVIKCFFFKKSH